MKKLGFGLMRLPQTDKKDPKSINISEMKDMVDAFIANDFTYFDTAWMYHAFSSEKASKEALTSRHDRNEYTLASKLHVDYVHTMEDRDKIFNTQLDNCGVEYFDYYLLHGIDESMYGDYEKYDCFNWIMDKKAAGLVKHAGFSFHDGPELLDRILTEHPEMEFVQLQINYLDWNSPWVRSKECYDVARKHNIDIIVMEPVKGGTLARLPEEAEKLFKNADPLMSPASWAIRFVASLPGIMVVLSGMSSIEEIEDNMSYMKDFKPLTEDEMQLCLDAADIINSQIAVPCTGCSYCTEGCPQNIAIPDYFSLYNEDMRESNPDKGWTVNSSTYSNLAEKFGHAGDCIECGACESICPQHISIIEELKKVSAHYDK